MSLAQGTLRAAEERPRHVVRSNVSGMEIAIEATSVERIEDVRTIANESEEAMIDIALILGLPPPEGDELDRRVLVVNAGLESKTVVVGLVVRVQELASTAFHQLPSFLKAIDLRTGIEGVFLDDDQIVYFLNIERISAEISKGEAR